MKELITVADVVADSSLETVVLSGAGGLTRQVQWAHSCEMPDPGEWLRPQELLMTIGLCIPVGEEDQRQFIASMDEAGLAGMTISGAGLGKVLTPGMLEESDRRDFPVLRTNRDTPLAAVSRMVASSNADHQTTTMLRLARLYQVTSQRDTQERRSGAPLSALFGTEITVVDNETGCVVVGRGLRAPEAKRSYPLQTIRPCTLLISDERALDAYAILHLSQVVTVDANEILQGAGVRSQAGQQILSQVLSMRANSAEALGERLQGNSSGYRAVAVKVSNTQLVPLSLALAGLSSVTTRTRGMQVVIVPGTETEQVKALLEEHGLCAGASALYYDLRDISGSVEEAISESQVARSRSESWREYEGAHVSLLGRSWSEQRWIVENILGDLASSDPKFAVLRETLFVFLDTDAHWNETAEKLNLHRQTVVYRLDRVEKLTGRSVRRIQDLSELWLARRSWAQLEGRDDLA